MNIFSLFTKSKGISDLAYKCTLDSLMSGDRLRVVLRNRSIVEGVFARGNDSEIVIKTDSQFVGVSKTDIADIIKQKGLLTDGETHNPKSQKEESSNAEHAIEGEVEQESIIEMLRENPDVDPDVDTKLLAAATAGNADGIRDLFRFYSSHKWICHYNGNRMICSKLAKFISIPRATKDVLSQKGDYLCSIYAIKGKMPPILVLSKYELISSNMSHSHLLKSKIKTDSSENEIPPNDKDQDSRQELFTRGRKGAAKSQLIDAMRNLFLPGFVYSLSTVGSRLRLVGFDSSIYGYSKLSAMFEWLKGEMVEVGKDHYGHPTVKFRYDTKNLKAITIAPQFAAEDFFLVIKNVNGIGRSYTFKEMETLLAESGLTAAACGYSSFEEWLRSLPSDRIVFDNSEGESKIRILGGNNPVSPLSDEQGGIMTGHDDEAPDEHRLNEERKGVITAFFAERHMGFLVEDQTNQTWFFHDSRIPDKQLKSILVDGKVGIDVLFSGNDRVRTGKYPAVDMLKALSPSDITNKEDEADSSSTEENTSLASNTFSGFSPIAEYRMRTCPYEGVDARSLKVHKFTEQDLKNVRKRYAELRQIRGYLPLELSKFQLTIATLKYTLGYPKGAVANSLCTYFRLCGEAAILNPKLSPQVANFYAIEALKVATPEKQTLLSCQFLLANTYDSEIPFIKGMKTIEDLQGLLKKMQQRGTLGRLIEKMPFLEMLLSSVVKSLSDSVCQLSGTPQIPIQEIEDGSDIVARCKSLTTVSTVYFSQLRDLLIQKIGKYSSYEREMLSSFKDNLSLLIEYSQKKHFLEKESLYLRQKQFFGSFKETCLSMPTLLLIETLLPAAECLGQIMQEDFSKQESRSPALKVENVLESDGYRLTPDGKIDLRLSIANTDESAPPIESLSLYLKDRESEESYYAGALGGASSTKELELTFKPYDAEIIDAAFSVDVMVSFRSRNGESQAGPFPVSVRLEVQEQEPIENPYLRYAGGLPIDEKDDRMFFGRDEMVVEICETLAEDQGGQCFVLYGQRRSGKTSVMRQIKNHLPEQCFYTSITAQSFDYSRDRILSEFAKLILDEVLVESDRQKLDSSNFPSFEFADKDSVLALKQIARELRKQGKNWIVSIDEFTSIYSQCGDTNVSAFMRAWKALLEGHVFNALIIGQDTMPKFKQAYPNEFSVTHDRRLSFLSADDTATLASEPINTKQGDSRYRGNSLTKIYQKTAGSPYFLQRFCSELVKYLNRKGVGIVTEADIEAVSDNLVHGRGDQPLVEENFDALVSSGEENLSTIPENELWDTLTAIAKHSNRVSGWCAIDELTQDPMYKHGAAIDLSDRGTLEIDGGRVRIRVELFAEWLRVNERC